MKFGIGAPTCREGVFYPVPFADSKDIVEITLLAENLGLDSIWSTDWITPTPKRKIPDTQAPNWYDLLISMAYCSAVTNRITLATGTVVLPFRDTVILAKQIATLDQFCNGRLTLGVGLGGNREEFTFIRAKDKNTHRGKLFDEQIAALNLLLSHDDVSFMGEYIEFNNVSLNPKPTKAIPVYFSGNGPTLFKRVAKWGSGLLIPVAKNRITTKIENLKIELDKVGRDVSEIDVAGHTYTSIAKTHEQAIKMFNESRLGRRYDGEDLSKVLDENLIGTPADIIGHIDKLSSEGMTHCIATSFAVDTFEELKEQVQMFAEEVVPFC